MPQESSSASKAPAPSAEALAFLTRNEAATAQAAMARIFPDDDLGPGAVEAGTVYYLDRALGGAELHLQEIYRAGLKALDAVAALRFGHAFAISTPAEQDELIGAMASDTLPGFGRAPTASAFFNLLRAHTLEGMFSDPVHGGNRNVAGWRLLGYLGPQPAYSHAEQQLDAVIVRDRIFTAADYPLDTPETAK